MDQAGFAAEAEAGSARGLLVAVPFYRQPDLVPRVAGSLRACAAELRSLGAALVFINDSPDCDELGAVLAKEAAACAVEVPCRVETNAENLGFVRSMNRAIADAVAARRDLLLLNSDARVTPGAIAEMVRVSRADPMIGFVNPRSDNATIATLPVAERIAHLPEAARGAAFAAFAARLPAWRFAPTAVGFCMLVRWHILAEFGGFDEIYGRGYNEENDLVMRAARCGYRAVLANHAFVWHDGEASFSAAAESRNVLEAKNRAILDRRYPDYTNYTRAYADSPEAAAEGLLAALTPDADGRLDLALDFSTFRTDHNGTFRAGRQLLEAAAEMWGDRFRVSVIASEEVYDFHGYAATGVARCDPHGPERFAVIVRVGQPYDWNAMQRMVLRGAVLGVFMLDTISVDCPQLYSPRLYNMWQFTLDWADLLITQSRHTAQQFATRFHLRDELVQVVSPHSLDLADYRFAPTGAAADGSLLVVGNHFHHKDLARTAEAVADALPDRSVVALGQRRPAAGETVDWRVPAWTRVPPNLRVEPGGERREAEIAAFYEACSCVIFPSHAEGFGFPLLHALAAEKPVFVRRLPVFAEIAAALGDEPNIHFYDTTQELIALLRAEVAWVARPAPPAGNDARRSAREIRAGIEAALPQAEAARIAARVRAMHFASDIGMPEGATGPGAAREAQAARFVAERVERLARRVFGWRLGYAGARLMFRGVRRVLR